MKRKWLWAAAAVTLGSVPALALKASEPPVVIKPTDLILLYEHDEFRGRSVALQGDTLDLNAVGFNDEASSLKLRVGYQATFAEDVAGRGEWFTYNCPPPIGIKTAEFCELSSIGGSIATGTLCQFKGDNAKGCVHWWNDRISSVMRVKPADPNEPIGRMDEGHD